MSVNNRCSIVYEILAVTMAVLFLAMSLSAQLAPPRTLDELKQETQRRVDENLAPCGGMKSEDAREALGPLYLAAIRWLAKASVGQSQWRAYRTLGRLAQFPNLR
ncbi:MAG TPA: hypothetical protein VNE63_21535 [Candidatus Acidoferrales bacterium]|nr:hypothetical protein [Candidatus Acidoferrales bacterium]